MAVARLLLALSGVLRLVWHRVLSMRLQTLWRRVWGRLAGLPVALAARLLLPLVGPLVGRSMALAKVGLRKVPLLALSAVQPVSRSFGPVLASFVAQPMLRPGFAVGRRRLSRKWRAVLHGWPCAISALRLLHGKRPHNGPGWIHWQMWT